MKAWQNIFGKNRLAYISLLMVFLMVFSAYIAYQVTTSFGYVTIREIEILGSKGNHISALLFVPNDATTTSKKPAILASHGYDNQKEFMVNTAIELARRGCVVLSIDCPGHGFSEGPRNIFDYGSTDALNYLRGLTYVDKNNIGLVGMSMGGSVISQAATNIPDGYKAMFFMDSIWGLSTAHKNVAIQWGYAEEFSPAGSTVHNSTTIRTYFKVTAPVTPGVVYGNITAGTGRILYVPYIDHPWSTHHPESITNVVEWFSMTLEGMKPIPKTDLIFTWKQVFTNIGFFAAIAFIITFGGYLLQTEYFKDLAEPLPEYKGNRGISYWISAAIITALGPILYSYGWGTLGAIYSETFLPLLISNRFMVWMNLVAFVAVLILILAFFILRRQGMTLNHLGLKIDVKRLLKTLLLASLIIAPVYIVVTYCYALLGCTTLQLEGWLFIQAPLRPLDSTRASYVPIYLPLFLSLNLVFGVVFAGFMRPKDGKISLAKEMIINSIILALGPTIYLLAYYWPIFQGVPNYNLLPNIEPWGGWGGWNMNPSSLGLIYFVPVPAFNVITACIITYFNRKTGKVWLGVLLATIFLAWYHTAFNCFETRL